MTDTAPLVSIAVPTHNRLAGLKRSVASLLAQTHQPIEIVISDNASDDGTREWALNLASEDSRVIYRRNPVNVGATENFELARAATTGEWFMWLADDDWLDDTYVETCLERLLADDHVALVAGSSFYFAEGVADEAGVVVQATGTTPASRVLSLYRQIVDNGTFYGLMHRSTIEATHAPRQRMGDDWLLLAEIAALGQVCTDPRVSVHRAFRADRTFEDLARSLGYSRFEGKLPYIAIAYFVVSDISFGSEVFRRLGPRRHLLAMQCAATIFRRFILTGLRPRSLARRIRAFLHWLSVHISTTHHEFEHADQTE